VPTRALAKPDLVLEESFSAVSGLRELSDGRLIIADGAEKTLRLFDPRTAEAMPIARSGGGPLEWGNVSRLHALPADSTLMEDATNGRFLLIGPDGRTSTFRLPDGSVINFSTFRGTGGGFMLFERGRPSTEQGPSARAVGIADLLRYDRRTQRIDTIAQLKWPEGERSYVRMLDGGMIQTVTNMPLAGLDLAVMAPDGRVAAVRRDPYRIDWIAPDRTVARGPVAQASRVRVTDAEKEAFLRSLVRPGQIIVSGNPGAPSAGGSGRARGGALQVPPSALNTGEATWPEFKPPFLAGAAHAAPDGRIWVLRTRAHDDPIATYDVFDASGKVAERIALPPGTRLAGFGKDVVYLARPDEDDLLRVERYRLR
jgi:hypothetical protein